MYNEEDLLPVSAIQHVLYCERQYALIHIERVWAENQFTAEGAVLHKRVDIEHSESRKFHKTEYAMAVRSLKYGLIGKTDLVEFEQEPSGKYLSIIPVEFKRGRNKEEDWDRVQLCAQALCLEEMFATTISTGQIYYLQDHRRTPVYFDQELREKTTDVLYRMRKIYENQETPPAFYSAKKCSRCSLQDICMPKIVNRGGKNTSQYVKNQMRGAFLDT